MYFQGILYLYDIKIVLWSFLMKNSNPLAADTQTDHSPGYSCNIIIYLTYNWISKALSRSNANYQRMLSRFVKLFEITQMLKNYSITIKLCRRLDITFYSINRTQQKC